MAASPTPSATINSNSLNNQNVSLSFPGNIKSQVMYTTLTFAKYNRARPNANRTDTTTATIVLPLPEGFGDSSSPLWGQTELNQIGGLADLKDDFVSAHQQGHSIFDMIKQNVSGANIDGLRGAGVLAMTLSPSSMRDGQIQSVAMQSLGAVVNPHLSLLFQGVALRPHVLAWKFSPHTEKEAKELGTIINKIRTRILPSFNPTVSRFALDYPDTVSATFEGIDKDYKTKIFKAAVTGFETNLAPSGLTFNPNGRPQVITMTLSMLETEICTREDFEGTTNA